MGYSYLAPVMREYQSVGSEPAVWFTCPHCGYDKVRFPTKPSVWKQYESEGTLTLKQDVVAVEHIHCLAERDVFMPLAVYIPACILSGTMAMAKAVPWQVFEGILVGGAVAILMFAVRYRRAVAEPVETQPKPEVHLPETTEVKRGPSWDNFNRLQVVYESNEPVPDYYLWKIANAYLAGTPFSRQMYIKNIVTRPAFEALKKRLVMIHWGREEGQDFILSPRAINLFREWAKLECPTPPPS